MKYKIGFTCGSFDLLHAGHVLMLEEAKSICEHLIVGLQNDPTIDRPNKNRPIQSIVERQIQLTALKHVDDVIIYNTEKDLLDLLTTLPIDVRIIGEDYKDKPFTGDRLCKESGIQIYFNARQHGFSSTNIRQRVVDAERNKPITISIDDTMINLSCTEQSDFVFTDPIMWNDTITPDKC